MPPGSDDDKIPLELLQSSFGLCFVLQISLVHDQNQRLFLDSGILGVFLRFFGKYPPCLPEARFVILVGYCTCLLSFGNFLCFLLHFLNFLGRQCTMSKPVQTAEEVVEEIMRMHRSLPPRTSLGEIEAAVALIQNVENTMSARLQVVSKAPKPPDVPDELFAVLQEMQTNRIYMQAEEEKREALALLDLEDRHRLFDYLVQKASCALSSSSHQSGQSADVGINYAPLSVKNSIKIDAKVADSPPKEPTTTGAERREIEYLGSGPKYSRDDSFIPKPKSFIPDGVIARSEVPRNLLKNSGFSAGLATLEDRPSMGKQSARTADTYADGEQKLSLVKLASLIEATSKETAESLKLQGRLTDQVEWLPESIGRLACLNELDLSENRIVTLPSSIQELSKLTKLDAHANRLQKLPDSIGELSSLMELDLHGNHLISLPASIGSLSGLVYLDLSANQLSSLPESIGQLTNLKRLNIEANEIDELPYTIGQCAALSELRADFNRIKALPEAVGKLESLQVLTLHYNRIKSLPTTMASLCNLKELDVSFNELESIPESLCLATSLVKLNVGRNFADLQKLPRSIGNLEMLDELDISNNQIKFLPDSFAMLANLRILHAEETPLEIPPRHIAERGAKAVVQFMIEHVAKRDEKTKVTKPKGRWSKFCSCLRKRKWEESNAGYVKAGV
eukprot:Gb_12683 [translate_table: standard]